MTPSNDAERIVDQLDAAITRILTNPGKVTVYQLVTILSPVIRAREIAAAVDRRLPAVTAPLKTLRQSLRSPRP